MSEITLIVTDRHGGTREVAAASGDVLMHILRDNISVDIGICDGSISCGTCLVSLEPDWLRDAPGPCADEEELLDVLGAGDGARLGCQVTLDDRARQLQVTLLHEE